MTDITLFQFGEHEIRTSIVDGEVRFIALDAARAIGYGNPNQALATHVDEEDKDSIQILDGNRGNPNVTTINESGLYSLILGSKLPGAKVFKRWVTSEVLPEIRKTGGYISPTASADQLMDATARIEIQMRVLVMAKGLVDDNWLEAKVRHFVARVHGEEPEVDPATHPLDVGTYLGSKGVPAAAQRSMRGPFGKAIKAAFIEARGSAPKKVERFVDGALREVNGYCESDRDILDRAWAAMTRAAIES